MTFVTLFNAWFYSGYISCFSTPGFWTNFPAFLVDLDSDPEAFLSVLTQNGEVCSVDASGYGPCMRSPHLKLHVGDSWHREGWGLGVSAQALAHLN